MVFNVPPRHRRVPRSWYPLNDSSGRIANLQISASVGRRFEDRHGNTRWASDDHRAAATRGGNKLRTCLAFHVRHFDTPSARTAAGEANAAAIPDSQFVARRSNDK